MKTTRRIKKKKESQLDWINDPVKVGLHLVELMKKEGFETKTSQGFHSVSVDIFDHSMYVTPGSHIMSEGINVRGKEYKEIRSKSTLI